MTLERWSVQRYRKPHLHIQAIRRLDAMLELDSQRGVFRLACDSATSIDDGLLPLLESLRDPGHALWRAIGQRETGVADLAPMLSELDHLGLIHDCAPADASDVQRAMTEALHAWSAELGEAIAAHGEPAALLVELLASRLTAVSGEPFDATLREPNFAILTLLLQARYLRIDAPLVLGMLTVGLHAATRRARLGQHGLWWSGIDKLPAWSVEEWRCGLLDPDTLLGYLAAAGDLVRSALGPDAGRRARAFSGATIARSGINFVVDLEGDIARTVAALGPSAAEAAMRDTGLAPRVVRAAYLQEYLVTCRFVECVAPLLSHRFAGPLRDAVHRYFAEEMGHEQFEYDNCLSLGIDAADIGAAAPMPLHLAFVDIITALARDMPIAFFCASIFTEGFIGGEETLVTLAQQAFPDDQALLRTLGRHDSLNDEADHRGVGRDWMSHVPVVAPATQAVVGEVVAYLAELNWRMWDRLVHAAAAAAASGSTGGSA